MPIRKMRDSNLFDILNIHNLRFFQGKSFRQLEKETNIPKSTLHYNIENVREKVAAFERSCEVGGRRSLVNLILTSTFDCQMSTRAISRLIKNIWNTRVSHQTISRILTTCSHLVWFSRREHEGLSKIDRCVTDEIYHKKKMILVLADPDSGFCLLQDSCCNIMSRPWHEFIDQCKEKGFYPKYNTADGGSMMASAFAQCLPKTKHIRDSFHILHYLRKAMKGMEGGCFSLMEQINYYRADCRAKRRLEARSAAGIEIFDKFCITFQHLKYAFNVGDPRQIGRYMNSEDLTQIVRRLQYLLNRFRNEAVRTPRVVDAAKYLENCEDHIRLYKSEMEEQLTKVFSRRERRICQNYFMTLIDFKEHRGRCYESKQRWEY